MCGVRIPIRARYFSPKRPDGLWGPPSHVFRGYRGSLSRVQRRVMMLTTHLYLVLRLRKSGVKIRLPLYAFMVWARYNLLYVYIPITNLEQQRHNNLRGGLVSWVNVVGSLFGQSVQVSWRCPWSLRWIAVAAYRNVLLEFTECLMGNQR